MTQGASPDWLPPIIVLHRHQAVTYKGYPCGTCGLIRTNDALHTGGIGLCG